MEKQLECAEEEKRTNRGWRESDGQRRLGVFLHVEDKGQSPALANSLRVKRRDVRDVRGEVCRSNEADGSSQRSLHLNVMHRLSVCKKSRRCGTHRTCGISHISACVWGRLGSFCGSNEPMPSKHSSMRFDRARLELSLPL